MQNPVAMSHTIDAGDDLFAPRIKQLSLRAIEQALRWSVVFRKVTHGFCSDWGAELFA